VCERISVIRTVSLAAGFKGHGERVCSLGSTDGLGSLPVYRGRVRLDCMNFAKVFFLAQVCPGWYSKRYSVMICALKPPASLWWDIFFAAPVCAMLLAYQTRSIRHTPQAPALTA